VGSNALKEDFLKSNENRLNTEHTFVPQISKKNDFYIDKPVGSRLYEDNKRRVANKKILRKMRED